MKLTWFGGTTIRIHIGGAILVIDAAGAPSQIDPAELVSGAERVFSLSGQGLETVETDSWRPRRPKPLDEDGDQSVKAYHVADRAILIDAIGEPPLILAADSLPILGRWAGDAVVVLFGDGPSISGLGEALLDVAPPKLIALAAEEPDVDFAIDALRDRLDGTGLVSLEAGLALEV